MLIEELRSGIDMVVSPRIGTANNHHSQPTCGGRGWVINAVIVDGWLQKMRIVLKPV